MNALQLSWLLFAAGACGGALLVTLGALRVRYPRWIPMGHGLLGLASCGLLASAVFGGAAAAPARAGQALAIFIATLLGGVLLFAWLKVRRMRLPLALGHGLLAVAGLYWLYGAAFPAAA